MPEWIGRAEALERLGVRPQTLYAYVSRGKVSARPDPADPRRSLYLEADLRQLEARRRQGRKADAIASGAMAWGQPSIPTRISTIEKERLIYRGRDAVELSRTFSLEDVAGLLWDQDDRVTIGGDPAMTQPPRDHLVAMAELAGSSRASLGRSPASLAADGAAAIARLAAGFGIAGGSAPVHQRLGASWSCQHEAGELLRRALVLIADHELNASSFAVRVTASTGASIAACILTGLTTLSGPRHGGAAASLAMLVHQAEQSGADEALENWLASGHQLQGFGHFLYPQGDVRARALMEGPLMERLQADTVMSALADAAYRVNGLLPNIDFALLAITRAYGLPQDSPFKLFALGRSVGWVAHAIEQVTTGGLIRPRARYTG